MSVAWADAGDNFVDCTSKTHIDPGKFCALQCKSGYALLENDYNRATLPRHKSWACPNKGNIGSSAHKLRWLGSPTHKFREHCKNVDTLGVDPEGVQDCGVGPVCKEILCPRLASLPSGTLWDGLDCSVSGAQEIMYNDGCAVKCDVNYGFPDTPRLPGDVSDCRLKIGSAGHDRSEDDVYIGGCPFLSSGFEITMHQFTELTGVLVSDALKSTQVTAQKKDADTDSPTTVSCTCNAYKAQGSIRSVVCPSSLQHYHEARRKITWEGDTPDITPYGIGFQYVDVRTSIGQKVVLVRGYLWKVWGIAIGYDGTDSTGAGMDSCK